MGDGRREVMKLEREFLQIVLCLASWFFFLVSEFQSRIVFFPPTSFEPISRFEEFVASNSLVAQKFE